MTQTAYEHEKWAGARFRKSSRSNGGTGSNCVELAYVEGTFGVRDSKLGNESPVLDISPAELCGLIDSIKSGEIA